jgi:DNA repair exonuclease SbcCD nuclease subunit
MSLRFIHTSDWQIGEVFRFVDDATMSLLQQARLEAIDRIGRLATERGIRHVLVAGDVYDAQDVSDRVLLQPVERMRAFPSVVFHLLPGNHDPSQPFGIWDRLQRADLPANIVIHATPEVFLCEQDRLAVLPAPLAHFRNLDDLSAYMDEAQTPEGYYRIGLAHGSIRGFGSEVADKPNFIDPQRPEHAGLCYLALGDWHGQRQISERVWYSGTHETDGFDVVDGGKVLLVSIESPGALPAVESVEVGSYRWQRITASLNSAADIDALETQIRRLEPGPLSSHLVRLDVDGALSLDDADRFNALIRESLSAALGYLRIEDRGLLPMPTAEDLARFGSGGFVRLAADRLMAMAADPKNEEREVAALALQRLYVMYRSVGGTGS